MDNVGVDKDLTQLEDVFDDLGGIPTSLIVTNVSGGVFVNEDEKARFERLFRFDDDDVKFEYFKSFKRVRVHYTTPEHATTARIRNHQITFGDNIIRCFFAQSREMIQPPPSDTTHLHPPALEKQFLISPPASPPVGWEQKHEAAPPINEDLLLRLQHLHHEDDEDGRWRRLVEPSPTAPGVNLIPCETEHTDSPVRIKYIHTPRPSLSSISSDH